MTLADDEVLDVSTLSPPELEAARLRIVNAAAGNWESLSTTQLRNLAAITGALRRRTAGPPKAAKSKPTPKSKKPTDADLLNLI